MTGMSCAEDCFGATLCDGKTLVTGGVTRMSVASTCEEGVPDACEEGPPAAAIGISADCGTAVGTGRGRLGVTTAVEGWRSLLTEGADGSTGLAADRCRGAFRTGTGGAGPRAPSCMGEGG